MKLYDKLDAAITLLTSVLEELRPGELPESVVIGEEEPEILLQRSQRNRRSDQNEVMGLAANNGAPAVPESWVNKRGNRSNGAQRVRAWIHHVLTEYEPMSKRDLYRLTRDQKPLLMAGKNLKTFHQAMSRLLVGKHIKVVHGVLKKV